MLLYTHPASPFSTLHVLFISIFEFLLFITYSMTCLFNSTWYTIISWWLFYNFGNICLQVANGMYVLEFLHNMYVQSVMSGTECFGDVTPVTWNMTWYKCLIKYFLEYRNIKRERGMVSELQFLSFLNLKTLIITSVLSDLDFIFPYMALVLLWLCQNVNVG